MLYTLNLRLH